jgi:hypothetical protein
MLSPLVRLRCEPSALERARVGLFARGEEAPLGVFPGSVLLQIGQRSMKRLWRQNVGIRRWIYRVWG